MRFGVPLCSSSLRLKGFHKWQRSHKKKMSSRKAGSQELFQKRKTVGVKEKQTEVSQATRPPPLNTCLHGRTEIPDPGLEWSFPVLWGWFQKQLSWLQEGSSLLFMRKEWCSRCWQGMQHSPSRSPEDGEQNVHEADLVTLCPYDTWNVRRPANWVAVARKLSALSE